MSLRRRLIRSGDLVQFGGSPANARENATRLPLAAAIATTLAATATLPALAAPAAKPAPAAPAAPPAAASAPAAKNTAKDSAKDSGREERRRLAGRAIDLSGGDGRKVPAMASKVVLVLYVAAMVALIVGLDVWIF